MYQVLLVGMGGFIGSALRYLLGGWIHRMVPFATFPYGTLAVNVIGSCLIGGLAGLSESRQLFGPNVRIFLFLGVLGGFTTFSSFAFETLRLAREAEAFKTLINIVLHLLLTLGGVWVGYIAGRMG